MDTLSEARLVGYKLGIVLAVELLKLSIGGLSRS